jgi:hypothetical protein
MTRIVSKAELNKPVVAHTEANDVHDYTFTPGCSEPRNMSGTTAHEKLRAFWGVKPGGNGKRPPPKTIGTLQLDMERARARAHEKIHRTQQEPS